MAEAMENVPLSSKKPRNGPTKQTSQSSGLFPFSYLCIRPLNAKVESELSLIRVWVFPCLSQVNTAIWKVVLETSLLRGFRVCPTNCPVSSSLTHSAKSKPASSASTWTRLLPQALLLSARDQCRKVGIRQLKGQNGQDDTSTKETAGKGKKKPRPKAANTTPLYRGLGFDTSPHRLNPPLCIGPLHTRVETTTKQSLATEQRYSRCMDQLHKVLLICSETDKHVGSWLLNNLPQISPSPATGVACSPLRPRPAPSCPGSH
ncbi:uncharacterized protein LOC117868717 [Trachemys scripta elegans]|uniref:uncharacterized protein LOC117868717 n=1 Tax=Trachemys scripta elegans TaxID=31138 RepID=UPI001557954D|nr:uncharacterized protein LOC117868717 [Trachemys scripta elegans]